MSEETKIQWCDSTVNPIMGCAGCELFPSPGNVLDHLDRAIAETTAQWKIGAAKRTFQTLVTDGYAAIDGPLDGHRKTVSTTNLWHFRERFLDRVRERHGPDAAGAAEAVIEREITCYAAKQHMNRGRSLLDPGRKANSGYAPTFEQITLYRGRAAAAAQWRDLLGTTDPDRPWLHNLPRLIFVSDMGDAFSRKKDFRFLEEEVIEPATSEFGRRHLWLWLTKRPELMADFATRLDGLPGNFCAMTTVTGPDPTSLRRIDDLRRVDAPVRGLSLEPIWERIPPEKLDLRGIDWLILGGESGSKKKHSRPFAIEWAEELRDHCRENGVAFFLKQLGHRPTRNGEDLHLRDSHGGDWSEWPDEALCIREFPEVFHRYRKDEATAGGLRRVRQGEMTPVEANDFKRLHKIVSEFARDTVVASDALYEIRDRRLYRGKFGSFSDYCESVHEMSRQYANRLIRAGKIRAEMVPIVSEMGLPEPRNEAQLRELARLPSPDERVDVYREAVEQATADSGKVTARRLSELIDRRMPRKPENGSLRLTPAQRLAQARSLLDRLELSLRETGIENELIDELRRVLGN